MLRRILIGLGMLVGLGLWAEPPAPPPSPAQQELQQKFTLDDGKPTQGRTVSEAPSGWRALGSTILVLALIGGGLWAFRKWGAKRIPGNGGTRLQVEETLALGERRHVSILRADDEHFLIALTPQGITLISRLDGVTQGASFQQSLQEGMPMEAPLSIRELEAQLKGGKR
nr:flagellar biosynthetic protein FliO [uncultured Holophaga sp.]